MLDYGYISPASARIGPIKISIPPINGKTLGKVEAKLDNHLETRAIEESARDCFQLDVAPVNPAVYTVIVQGARLHNPFQGDQEVGIGRLNAYPSDVVPPCVEEESIRDDTGDVVDSQLMPGGAGTHSAPWGEKAKVGAVGVGAGVRHLRWRRGHHSFCSHEVVKMGDQQRFIRSIDLIGTLDASLLPVSPIDVIT